MTKENSENFPRSVGDLITDLTKSEAESCKKILGRVFKERYAKFKSKDIKSIDLYAGDFRPQISFTSQSPLQIILPSDISMTINYEDLFTKFVKSFSEDVWEGSFELGSGEEIPDAKTTKLKDFITENPNKQLPFTYFKYELKSDPNYERRIVVKRYFEDFTFEKSVSEIWTASRYNKAINA